MRNTGVLDFYKLCLLCSDRKCIIVSLEIKFDCKPPPFSMSLAAIFWFACRRHLTKFDNFVSSKDLMTYNSSSFLSRFRRCLWMKWLCCTVMQLRDNSEAINSLFGRIFSKR